ncbi:MAG: hypothetical protein HOV80_15040, partial [Polyangiaceae bacterium]|nr:hypothetical protein [Polyangiaceae bacterium]
PPASAAPPAPPPSAEPPPSSAAPPPSDPAAPPVPEQPPPPPPVEPTSPANPQPPQLTQPPPFVPPPILFYPPRMQVADKPENDLLMVPIGSSVSIGAIFMISGAIVMGTAGGDEYCGIGGCTERPDHKATNLGASLIGAGAGFATAGGLGMLAMVDPPSGTEQRRSQPLAMTGFTLTSLAAAGLGVGIAQAASYGPNDDLSTTWPWLMASTITAGVGIPMLVIGSKKQTQEERDALERRRIALDDPNSKAERFSTGMVVTGGILTGLGGLGIIAGTGFFFADVALGGPSEDGAAFAGVAFAPGTVLTAAGIPLIVAGARRDIDPNAPPAIVPDVRLSGTGVGASWSFE